MDMLDALVELSHEFGTKDYVCGGGGNSSCKDAETLWIKPSGTTLAETRRDSFVAMDRAKLAEIFVVTPPADVRKREAVIKEMMLSAVRADSMGRPSVEAPLHESFHATFVVHVHAALVNGMTCAREGAAACKRLFPDALWVPYADPGYALCMACRAAMADYSRRTGGQPGVVFLQNHGVFAAGDSAEAIREQFGNIMDTLRREYDGAGVATELAVGPAPEAEAVRRMTEKLRASLGDATAVILPSGRYAVSGGPISPDHVCFAGAYPLAGEPTADTVAEFKAKRGYAPRVLACDEGVFGVGRSEKDAALAVEFSRDGALVRQLAEAFGGIRYLDDASRDFIENWEVEAFRRKVATG